VIEDGKEMMLTDHKLRMKNEHLSRFKSLEEITQ